MNAPPTDTANLADPDFWFRPGVGEVLADLRSQPIRWHEHPDSGRGFWSLVRHSDVGEANRDWKAFTSTHGVRLHHDFDPHVVRPGSNSMIELDPPQHTKYRRPVSHGFTPRQAARLDNSIRARIDEILSGFEVGQEVDFVADIAGELTLRIICDLLGVDLADGRVLRDLSDKSTGDQDPSISSREEGVAAARRIQSFGLELARRRLEDPSNDLISEIARLRIDDEPASAERVGGYFSQLFTAGHETTRSTLAHGLLAFERFPEQRTIFMSDVATHGATAADEIVRWASPARQMGRVVQAPIEFRGQVMQAGDKVALWYVAANRDPDVFDEPDRFDVRRERNRHQAFGAGGPHFCMGASIARTEIWMLLAALFERFPDVHPVAEPRRLRSIMLNGITELRVRL